MTIKRQHAEPEWKVSHQKNWQQCWRVEKCTSSSEISTIDFGQSYYQHFNSGFYGSILRAWEVLRPHSENVEPNKTKIECLCGDFMQANVKFDGEDAVWHEAIMRARGKLDNEKQLLNGVTIFQDIISHQRKRDHVTWYSNQVPSKFVAILSASPKIEGAEKLVALPKNLKMMKPLTDEQKYFVLNDVESSKELAAEMRDYARKSFTAYYRGLEINKIHYSCTICGDVFSTSVMRRIHERRHRDEAYKCEICFKIFDTADHLERHQIVHSDERPFECDTCGESFKSEQVLVEHQLIHQEATVPCRETGCPEKFGNSSKMLKHFKRTHENIKDLKGDRVRCRNSKCDKEYHSNKLLAQGCENLGKGDNFPYKCPYWPKCIPDCKRQYRVWQKGLFDHVRRDIQHYLEDKLKSEFDYSQRQAEVYLKQILEEL